MVRNEDGATKEAEGGMTDPLSTFPPNAPDVWLDHGDTHVYHGDCRDVIPYLPRGFQLLLTDPPYGISIPGGDIHRSSSDGKKVATMRREFFADDDADAPLEGLQMAIDILDDVAGALIYCGHGQFGAINAMLKSADFQTGPFVWIKTNPAPSVRMRSWRSCIELAVWGTRGGGFHWINQDAAKNHVTAPACVHGHPEKNGHPTQKPTRALLQAIHHYTSDGGSILDPFCGSGSTLEAARKVGRRFAVGIEKNEDYLPLIAERLSQQSLLQEIADA